MASLYKSYRFWLPICAVTFLFINHAWAAFFAPEWVTSGQAKDYPTDQYLVGIGMAPKSGDASKDQAIADETARAKIAEQIRVEVYSYLESYMAEQTITDNGLTSREGIQRVTWQVKSKVTITLEDVEFVERYYDKRGKTYYSLAVLARGKASALRRKKALELQQAAEAFLQKARDLEAKGDFSGSLQSYQKARLKVVEALAYESEAAAISRSRIPSMTGSGLTPWTVDIARDEMLGRAGSGIYLVEENPFSPESMLAAPALAEKLEERGYRLDPAHNPFKVVGEVEAQESSQIKYGGALIIFYKSRFQVRLVDCGSGEVISRFASEYDEATKVGNTRPAQAAAESLAKAGGLLGEKIANALDRHLKEGKSP